MPLTVRPLTPDLWPAFADFFASPDASSDPRWCWCAYWRVRGLDWSNSTAEGNRTLLGDIVAGDGRPPGLVALDEDGTAIGWVSVGPREDYERLEHSRVLARLDDAPVWSIVCFVVAKRARGEGVARALLDAAIAFARAEGARVLEAYPIDTAGGRMSSASVYVGSLSMFESAGFDVAAVRQASANARPRPIVRLAID